HSTRNKTRDGLIRVRNIRALNGRFNTSITHAYSIVIGSKHITLNATGGGFLTASKQFRHGATSKSRSNTASNSTKHKSPHLSEVIYVWCYCWRYCFCSCWWRHVRSEERRVGKECRSWWSPYQQKKKAWRRRWRARHEWPSSASPRPARPQHTAQLALLLAP